VICRLYRLLSHQPEASYVGGKETVCEEFLPYLLGEGFVGLVIVRDPRDVLTSLNHGRGGEFGGRAKPTLFNLRAWRRSVAFALHLADQPAFAWLRYEDLVDDPRATLDRVSQATGLPRLGAEHLAGPVRDQSGEPWKGNSSHGDQEGISRASVGRWRQRLPEAVARFAEAVCRPELLALGYPVQVTRDEVPDVLRDFEDPYPLDRPELARYAEDPAEIEAEITRHEILTGDGDGDGDLPRALVLFPDVGRRLRALADG
jgi:hypothetical protein